MNSGFGNFLRAVVAAVLVAIGWLGTGPAAAEPVPLTSVNTYDYDRQNDPPASPNTTAERAPPKSLDHRATHDSEDALSRGVSARPPGIAPPAAFDYDRFALLVRDARTSRTTEGQAGVVDGDLSTFSGTSVAAKTADDWPILSGIVRDASKGKGNFGLGSGSASQATRAGESWVGEGYRVASDGKTLVSRDGLRTFRPPTWKPNEGKYQANFEYRIGERVGKPFGNGHLDIMDMGP